MKKMLSRPISMPISRSITRDGVLSGSGYTFSDSDAEAYVTLVETADGETLENGVKEAIDNFVAGCKTDGIWADINAAVILAGARTLTGALVPLKGTAPTNVNFVSGDYSRTNGLTGNGSTKYLNSNRAADADDFEDMHLSVYVTGSRETGVGGYIGGSASSPHAVLGNATGFRARVNSATLRTLGTGTTVPSCIAVSRPNAAGYDWCGLGQSGNQVDARVGGETGDITVFARGGASLSACRLAFYSIGSATTLADLDSRIATLVSAIGTALA